MVGMNYSGTSLGGFVGHIYGYNTKYSLINCYSAGEVGSIDTSVDSVCGGFAGSNDATDINFNNCFYDMQNTSMRGKVIGSQSSAPITHTDSNLSSTLFNIKGIDTESLISNPLGASYTSSHGLYPQLSSMASHFNPKFRAASAASVATVFCDTWDDLGMSSTAFDTVRDTIRSLAFSSTTPFTSNPSFSAAYVDNPHITNITWEADGNASPLDNATPVVSLTESSPYYATSLAPGIEWLTVTVEYTTDDGTKETASRRVRLIPTSTMKIGSDARIDVYDDESMTDSFAQQDGFSATYLDATTLRDYILSNELHPEALVAFPSPYAETATSAYGTSSLPFNTSTKSMDISATISQEGGNAIEEDLLMREVTSKMCGEKKFTNPDLGTYMISYKAAIPDGRYLSDSRKVIVLNQYSVVYYYNYTGMLAGNTISPESIFAYQGSLRDYKNFDYTSPYDEEDLIRDGWRFSYWSLDPEGKQPVTQRYFDEYEERHGTLDHNTNLYAQWNRLMPNTETTLAVDPKDGAYPDGDVSGVKMFSGVLGDRIAIDSAMAPLLFSFDKWEGTELGGGTLEYSENTDTWLFTFGNEDARIEATYTPLFEDNGLVIGGKKIFESGELVGDDFQFELVPFKDALRDPYQVSTTAFGDGIDDARQAKITFHVINGEFLASGMGTDYSTAMTIRDENGELLPESERTIIAGSEHYTPPMQNAGYDGTVYWMPYDPTSRPIDGDIEFTCKFKLTGLPDIPAPDIPVPDTLDMPDDVDIVPLVNSDAVDSAADSVVSAAYTMTENSSETVASNDVDGNFSFDALDLAYDGVISGNKDGYTYFCFKLREVEGDDSFVSYDKREYVVQVRSVLYNGRYVPTDISYWREGDAEYLERVGEDDVVFTNKKLWIQMPETGSSAGIIVLGIGTVTSAMAFALIYANSTKKRRSEKKRP